VAATAYRRKQAEVAKVARQRAAEERHEAKKARLQSWLQNGRLKSCNATLQLLKNLTIHLTSVNKKLHTVLQKI
jgi:hypothetical protein